jgi:hypothetical protein
MVANMEINIDRRRSILRISQVDVTQLACFTDVSESEERGAEVVFRVYTSAP